MSTTTPSVVLWSILETPAQRAALFALLLGHAINPQTRMTELPPYHSTGTWIVPYYDFADTPPFPFDGLNPISTITEHHDTIALKTYDLQRQWPQAGYAVLRMGYGIHSNTLMYRWL